MPKSVALIGPTDIHIKQSRLESTWEHQITGTATGSDSLLELAELQKRSSRAHTHGSGKRSTKSQLLNVIIWVFRVALQGDVPYLMSHSHDPPRGVCVPEKASGCPLSSAMVEMARLRAVEAFEFRRWRRWPLRVVAFEARVEGISWVMGCWMMVVIDRKLSDSYLVTHFFNSDWFRIRIFIVHNNYMYFYIT